MGKEIRQGKECISRIERGVNLLSDTVKVTLGPKGRYVALTNAFGEAPVVTKDGVSVAREIVLTDPIENAGAQLIKEVAQKTADVAGDGTTTATILAQAIFREGLKITAAGSNPVFVKKGIETATNMALAGIRKMAKTVTKEDLVAVATISANNDKILGKLIADAMDNAGEEGVITVEESATFQTHITCVDGLELPRGYISPYFITNPKNTSCELTDCKILVTDKEITHINSILAILNACAQDAKPLLIIALNVEGIALSTLLLNVTRGQLKCCAIKAPYFGEIRIEALEDIAAVTGATVINDVSGILLENVTLQDLGSARKVTITKETCTIVNGAGDENAVKTRIQITHGQLATAASDFEKEKTQERLAKLSGGVVVLNIGAATEPEMKEKKARVEDALHATRAAVESGIVPGGGIAYLCVSQFMRTVPIAQDSLSSENAQATQMGFNVVIKALEEPIRQICDNAGLKPDIIISKILENANGNQNYGYDVLHGEYGDLIEMGIIDPTLVTVSALQFAMSVASILLTLDAVVADKPESKDLTDNMNACQSMIPSIPR